MPSTKAPKYVLTAMDDKEDKDKQIANLKAMVDEREQTAKKAMDDHDEEVKTAIKAIIATMEHDGREIPVVKAKLQAMEDKEEDEAMKAIIKAAIDVFDEGNGEQVNNKTQVGETLKEPATKVVEAKIAKAVKPLEAKIAKPIIAQILKANALGGATQDQINDLQKSLTAKTLEEVETYYTENQVLIANSLSKASSENTSAALLAKEEGNFAFNGTETYALTGNQISIDDTLEKVTL